MFPKLCVVNIRRHFWGSVPFHAEAGKFRSFLTIIAGVISKTKKRERSSPISQTPVIPLDVSWATFDWAVCRDTNSRNLALKKPIWQPWSRCGPILKSRLKLRVLTFFFGDQHRFGLNWRPRIRLAVIRHRLCRTISTWWTEHDRTKMQHKNLNDHLAPPKMLPRTPGWEPLLYLNS